MDTTEESANAGSLQEFIHLQLTIRELDSPAREKTLLETVTKISGVKEATFGQGKLLVKYEPMETSQEKIRGALERAGFQIEAEKAAAASAMTDALQNQLARPDGNDAPPREP